MGTPNSGGFGEILQRMGEDSTYLTHALEERESQVLDQEILIVEKLVQAIKPVIKYIDKAFSRYCQGSAHGALPETRGVELEIFEGYRVILTREGKFYRHYKDYGRSFHTGEELSPAECCRELVRFLEYKKDRILIELIQELLKAFESALAKLAERDKALEERKVLLSEVLKILKS